MGDFARGTVKYSPTPQGPMIKKTVIRNINLLYRQGNFRRLVKESGTASILPKLYYHFFLKDKDFPNYINIEITNECNLSCPMCPNSIIPKEKKGYMKIDLVQKIIQEVDINGTSNLLFVKQGEPFLHPQVREIFTLLRQTKNRQNVLWVSNGTTLNNKHIEALIEFQIDELNLSIDSIHPETYFKIRRVELDKTIANLEQLLKRKAEEKSDRPHISVNMVVRKDNVDEMKSTRAFFKKHKIQLTVQKYNPSFTSLDVGTDRWTLGKGDITPRYPCPHVFVNFVINYDGSVCLCCADWEGAFKIGDLNRNSIREIWNSDKYREVRKNHLSGQYERISICKDCTAWENNPNVFFSREYPAQKK